MTVTVQRRWQLQEVVVQTPLDADGTVHLQEAPTSTPDRRLFHLAVRGEEDQAIVLTLPELVALHSALDKSRELLSAMEANDAGH